MLGGVRNLHLPLVLMNRPNKTESAVFLYYPEGSVSPEYLILNSINKKARLYLCVHYEANGYLFFHADNEGSDHTVWMPMLILVIDGPFGHFWILSCMV